MDWALSYESHLCPIISRIEVIRKYKKTEKSATKEENSAEDIINKNGESSEMFEVQVLAEGTIDKRWRVVHD